MARLKEAIGLEPPEERSRFTAKRKHIYFEYDEDNEETESVIVRETWPKNNPVSNRFAPIRPCSSSWRFNRRNCDAGSGSDINRKWVFSSTDCSNHKDKVIVVSYNILAAGNASKHADLYLDVPPEFLQWDRRKHLIFDEVCRYNASILCFQEVDRFDDLEGHLRKDGFTGIYKARTGEACDGCALFWKANLFTLLHEESIEFQKFGLRDNVAQLCILKMNRNDLEGESNTYTSGINGTGRTDTVESQTLLFGNIHVLFNEKRGDVKLGQVRLFLEKAYKLSQEWGEIPVVLAGDYNSIPQSAMYQYLSSSELNVRLHDRRSISGQLKRPPNGRYFRPLNNYMKRCLSYTWTDEELMLATGSEKQTFMQHKLKLSSAYAGVPGSQRTRNHYGEPLATSCHSQFMGTVDYIWHTEELVPIRVLETLTIDMLWANGGLPSERWGSDHLAVVCELAYSEDRERS